MGTIKTKQKNKEMQSVQPSKSKEKKNNSDDHKNCHQNGNVKRTWTFWICLSIGRCTCFYCKKVIFNISSQYNDNKIVK